MTKEQMIDKLIDSVDDWDISALINWVKFERRSMLEAQPVEKIKEIYDIEIG